MRRRWTIRARLVVVLAGLLTGGLVISALVTTAALRSHLLREVDDSLDVGRGLSERRLAVAAPPVPSGVLLSPPPGLRETGPFAARITSDGQVIRELSGGFGSVAGDALEELSGARLTAAATAPQRFDQRLDGTRYRILVDALPGTSDLLAVLVSLDSVDSTLRQFGWVVTGTTAVLVVAVVVVALWLVKIGLRPLRDMVDTADAIAAGDLRRRVEATTADEVGRLAVALNAAFEARATSESRLRSFVADASHELRTPLSTIRGYAELLRLGAVGPDRRDRAVERIESEATRMGAIVDDLLTLARLDRDPELTSSAVDLSQLATDAVADARATEPSATWHLDVDGPLEITGDENALRQAVGNLVANVRLHAPTRTFGAVSVRRHGSTAVIEVRDDGPGISSAHVPHVFERFWRADDEAAHRARGHGGSGLGLAIVRAVARAHGGDAELLLTGRGTTVRLFLPLHDRSDPAGDAVEDRDELA